MSLCLVDVVMDDVAPNVVTEVLPPLLPVVLEQVFPRDERHALDAARLGLEGHMVPIYLYGQVADTTHQIAHISAQADMGMALFPSL